MLLSDSGMEFGEKENRQGTRNLGQDHWIISMCVFFVKQARMETMTVLVLICCVQ